MPKRCQECGAELEAKAQICPECGWSPFLFQEGDLTIQLLTEDGVRVPASQLFYQYGDDMIIGELTYSHALVRRIERDRKGREKEVEYETVTPVLVWARYRAGELVERNMKPYQMTRTLTLNERPIIVEIRTRMAGHLETLMTLGAAQRFLDGCEAIDWREAYEWVTRDYKGFVDFYWDPRLYDIHACWDIGSYFIDIFSTYPFLYSYGSQGVGKTRNLKTATYMARHGFVVTDPTEATLYRMAEALRPTMGIDESLIGPKAWKLTRTAFAKGSKVPRMVKVRKEKFVLGLFETYMPMVFASTKRPRELGGEDADEARAIFVYMERASDPSGRHPQASDFEELRDELYLMRLLRAGEVVEALKRMETMNLGLYGHDREVWLPIFTIASLIGDDVFEAVRSYARDEGALKRLYEHQDERLITRAILLRYRDVYSQVKQLNPKADVSSIDFQASQLLEYLERALIEAGEFDEGLFKKEWSPHRVGRLLTRMKIFKRTKHGRSIYTVTPTLLRSLYKRYFAGKPRGGLGGFGGLISKGHRQKEKSTQGEKGIPPSKNNPPNPPNPPTSIEEELLRAIEAEEEVGNLWPLEWLGARGYSRKEAREILDRLRASGRLIKTRAGWRRARI
jgi:hypothetical protein